MLVEQRAGVTTCKVNTVKPGRARQRSPSFTEPHGFQTFRLLHQPGGLLFFSRFFLDRPPGWGVRLVGGVVHSRAVATVARWSDPGRANGEEWAPHAENGLGGNEAALQPAGRQSPRQRVKL